MALEFVFFIKETNKIKSVESAVLVNGFLEYHFMGFLLKFINDINLRELSFKQIPFFFF